MPCGASLSSCDRRFPVIYYQQVSLKVQKWLTISEGEVDGSDLMTLYHLVTESVQALLGV